MEIETSLRGVQDFDVLLEYILTESRKLVNADAGSIYICENSYLQIKYAQNDTQQAKLKPGEKLPFVFFSFPINQDSIVGYSVQENRILNIEDVYSLDPSYPCSFNKRSDLLTGYRTCSMIVVPLVSSSGKQMGAIQLINARNKDAGIVSFDKDAEVYINHLASSVLYALERAYLSKLMVMRMIKMAGFRDPKETGSHVNRVSTFAIEIYDRWSFNHKISAEENVKFRDSLKIAATLHDVGKIGIPDEILKKPGKFNDREYAVIKTHSCIGACLFDDIASGVDQMSRDVALHHHERWDGKGYPGNVDCMLFKGGVTIDNKHLDTLLESTGLAAEDIPLAARIVSVADVFDALCSLRVYKEAWTVDDAVAEIKTQSGKQFDPEVVDAFCEILPRIMAIRTALPDA
ncbi:MAG: HD domain-containing protein [Treponemataceae bacterium]|nr:MAG: HD domain-containing protein [Treponemataceae bacterium]